jgi:hypothetical protein
VPKTLVISLAFLISFPCLAWGLNPESPEVKALIKKGLDFLDRGAPAVPGMPVMAAGVGPERLGETVLMGLSFYKAGKEDHKLVKAAVAAVYAAKDFPNVDNYSLGLSIIFLSEIEDPSAPKHLAQIQLLVDQMVSRQQVKGGFGYYKDDGKGDTSQIQYAVLAFWNARNVGAKVPQDVIEKVCDFLLRIQDPTGGFCYNGTDPGNYQRVPQTGISHSLTAAGLGSICVCADMLGIHQRRGGDEQQEDTGLPSALKVVKKPKTEVIGAAPETRIDPTLVERAIKDGENWFVQNYKIETGMAWNYYYLYGLERCESFRELYYTSPENISKKKEHKWYNDGYAFLVKKGPGGGWSGDHSAKASTSFAILFLLRSSQKAIAKVHNLGEGVLSSGKGLPADLANVTVKRGQIVDAALAAEVEDITKFLEDPDNPDLIKILENNEDFKLDPDSTKRSNQIVKLRSLVSAGNWEARMLAVRGLGKVRDLDNVPSLLYALTDPDDRVVLEADAALRFISRKLRGVGMPAEPNKEKKEAQDARHAWRNWYLSIRPNAELID